MIEFVDKTAEKQGTPINRENMMALQGFVARTTVFEKNSKGKVVRVVETNGAEQTKTTTFNDDGSITETFVGEKTITKKTTFNADGNINEVIL